MRTKIKFPIPLTILIGAILILGLAFFFGRLDNQKRLTIDMENLHTNRSIGRDRLFDKANVLYVFESSDCVFCRRLNVELAKISTIEVRTFILPGHSSSSRADADAAWCSRDQLKVWNAIMAGKDRPVAPPCDTDAVDGNLSDARKIGISATPALIDSSGNVLFGFHTDKEIIQWLADK
jgi:hypothetical protein